MIWDFDAVARREEQREALGSRLIADVAEPIAGGWMCCNAPGSWNNQANALGLDGPVSEEEVERLVDFYVSRQIQPQIQVCPFAHKTLIEGLGKHGFRVREFINVLACPVNKGETFAADLSGGWPEDLEIVRVDPNNTAQTRIYTDIVNGGFLPNKPIPEHWTTLLLRILNSPGCEGHLALVDGVPVGGGTVEIGEAGAALIGASVLPEFRRRGIQQALIARRMERVAESGGDLVVIQSSPAIPTERNARRLGFFLAYTKVVLVKPGPGLVPSA